MNSNYQEWHNTTFNDMVERSALRITIWRKLELLWKESQWTLREGIKSLMNHHVEPPWRTPVTKGWSNGRKEKLKTQGEALRWFRWRFRRNGWGRFELRKRKDEASRTEKCDMLNHSGKKKLDHLGETIIRITLCVSFTNLNWWQATD